MTIKHLLTSKPIIILEIGIILLLGFNVGQEMLKRQALESEVRSLEADIGRLGQNKSELSSLLDYVKTDAFVEAEARSKLNLAKDGEKLVLVPAVDSPTEEVAESAPAVLADSLTPPPAQPKPKTNPERWWDYFFERERLWEE